MTIIYVSYVLVQKDIFNCQLERGALGFCLILSSE